MLLLKTDFVRCEIQHKQHALFCFVFRNNHNSNIGGEIFRQGIVSFVNIFTAVAIEVFLKYCVNSFANMNEFI